MPRVRADSTQEGHRLGHKRVARLMREAGATPLGLLERNFGVETPDQFWVDDLTYVPTWAWFIYLAVMLDAC